MKAKIRSISMYDDTFEKLKRLSDINTRSNMSQMIEKLINDKYERVKRQNDNRI
jgi:hypothetical protein